MNPSINSNIANDEELGLKKNTTDFQRRVEKLVVEKSPWPISYDVDSVQPDKFTEFSYTDSLKGVYINTQSIEINCRIIEKASKVECSDFTVLNALERVIGDKYQLTDTGEGIKGSYQIGFMVGHNMFDIVSNEIVARLAHENDNFYMKLHPITNHDYARKVAHHVGWNRVISNELAAYDLLKGADKVWTSTASELTMAAAILGKKIGNLSNFFNEAGGIYYPISRLLYQSEDPRQTLNNIINCKFSGLIVPGIEDVEQHIKTYFDHALWMRREYGAISSKNNLKKVPIHQD